MVAYNISAKNKMEDVITISSCNFRPIRQMLFSAQILLEQLNSSR